MMTLIIGYPGSGKSRIAEDVVLESSGPGDRIYIASMIPYGRDGAARVRRHREMRAGKGFTTIEAPYDILETLRSIDHPERKTVLLECLSNLTANELFERKSSPEKTEEKLVSDVLEMSERVRHLIVVSNHYDISQEFDEETVLYSRVLDSINEKLIPFADRTLQLKAPGPGTGHVSGQLPGAYGES